MLAFTTTPVTDTNNGYIDISEAAKQRGGYSQFLAWTAVNQVSSVELGPWGGHCPSSIPSTGANPFEDALAEANNTPTTAATTAATSATTAVTSATTPAISGTLASRVARAEPVGYGALRVRGAPLANTTCRRYLLDPKLGGKRQPFACLCVGERATVVGSNNGSLYVFSNFDSR